MAVCIAKKIKLQVKKIKFQFFLPSRAIRFPAGGRYPKYGEPNEAERRFHF